MKAYNRKRALEDLLEAWAEWTATLNGFPSAAPEKRLRDGTGGQPPCSRPPKGIGRPRYLDTICHAIHAMGDFHPHYHRAIAIRYLTTAPPDEQVNHWQQSTGKSRRAYYETLALAKAWLDGRVL